MLSEILPNAVQSLHMQLDTAARALQQQESSDRVTVALTPASLFSPDSQLGMFDTRQATTRVEEQVWQVWGNNLMIAPWLGSLVIYHYDPQVDVYAPISPDDFIAGLLAETNLKRLDRTELRKMLNERILDRLKAYETE